MACHLPAFPWKAKALYIIYWRFRSIVWLVFLQAVRLEHYCNAAVFWCDLVQQLFIADTGPLVKYLGRFHTLCSRHNSSLSHSSHCWESSPLPCTTQLDRQGALPFHVQRSNRGCLYLSCFTNVRVCNLYKCMVWNGNVFFVYPTLPETPEQCHGSEITI